MFAPSFEGGKNASGKGCFILWITEQISLSILYFWAACSAHFEPTHRSQPSQTSVLCTQNKTTFAPVVEKTSSGGVLEQGTCNSVATFLKEFRFFLPRVILSF
jgi:hypothetical protein